MRGMARNPTARHMRAGFLEALKIAGNVTEACTLAGIDRTTVYRWRRQSTKFAAAWDDACEVAWDALEREAIRRAKEGWDEPVFQGGKLVGHVRKFSDRLLEVTLKAKRAREYREAAASGATVNVNAPTLVFDPAPWRALAMDPGAREAALSLLAHLARQKAPQTAPAIEARVVDVVASPPPPVNGKAGTNGHAGNGSANGKAVE